MNDEKYSFLNGNSGINSIFNNNFSAGTRTPAAPARSALLWPAGTYTYTHFPFMGPARVVLCRGAQRGAAWRGAAWAVVWDQYYEKQKYKTSPNLDYFQCNVVICLILSTERPRYTFLNVTLRRVSAD